MFSGEMDANNAFVDIQAGAGGTEAQDWAGCCCACTCAGRSATVSGRDAGPARGEVAGIKSATSRCKVPMPTASWAPRRASIAWCASPFDSGTAGTPPLPRSSSTEVDDEIDIEDNGPADRRLPFVRRRRPARQQDGVGGAHHPPPDQHRGRLPERAQPAQEPRHGDEDARGQAVRVGVEKRNVPRRVLEATKSDIGWGSQIRNYVLDQSRIKDLRTGVEGGEDTVQLLDAAPQSFMNFAAKARRIEMTTRNTRALITRAEKASSIAEQHSGSWQKLRRRRRYLARRLSSGVLAGQLHDAFGERSEEWLEHQPDACYASAGA